MKLQKAQIKHLVLGTTIAVLIIAIVGLTLPNFLVNKANMHEVKFQKNQDLLTYIDYNSNTKFQNEKNVLFFKANWCGTCTIADKNFLDDLKNIPEFLTIYRADFEKEIELRQKYRITYQHTFVQVDHSGNKLKQWAGSYTIEEVLSELV